MLMAPKSSTVARIDMSNEILKELRNLSDRLITLEATLKVQRSDEKEIKEWRSKVDTRIFELKQFTASQASTNRVLSVIGAAAITGLVIIAIKVVFGG